MWIGGTNVCLLNADKCDGRHSQQQSGTEILLSILLLGQFTAVLDQDSYAGKDDLQEMAQARFEPGTLQ